MKKIFLLTLLLGTFIMAQNKSIYNFSAKSIDQNDISFDSYKGKVILVVNTASKCGYTPQYEGLEKLYQKYKEKGFIILGFPCNQFGKQEPGSEKEIQEFCTLNYGVSFPMFSKIDVNGENENEIYSYLKSSTDNKPIKWNFEKFLINKDGNVIDRFVSKIKPGDLDKKIKLLLD